MIDFYRDIVITRFLADLPLATKTGSPVVITFTVYYLTGLITGRVQPKDG